MNKLAYLLSLRASNKREIYDTWVALGKCSADNDTKVYVKDSIFQVTQEGFTKGAIIYCNYEYSVNPEKGFEKIDWAEADIGDIDKLVYFYQGIASPNFKVLLTADEVADIDLTIPSDENFIPFNNAKIHTSSVNISDAEYRIIAAELGVPFLSEEELEYNRDTIIDICIKPALDQYYAYYPIVIDEAVGPVSANEEFKVEYHDFEENPSATAYKAIPFMTVGGVGGSTKGGGFSNAFSFMRENMGGMGGMGYGMGGFGKGIRYRKSVPGYVGMDERESLLMQRAAMQGYLNYFRQEFLRDKFEYGKKYACGFSSIGGSLNIHWLCTDNDYSHIDYWMLPNVRKLCTAYALRNIGMLRSLIKPGDTNPIDYSIYTTRADALEEKVLGLWEADPSRYMFAIQRGGK